MTGTIKVKSVTEHQDGSATYTFDLDDKAKEFLQDEGLTFLLHCKACGLSVEDVYSWMDSQVKDIKPMSDEERQASKKRQQANED